MTGHSGHGGHETIIMQTCCVRSQWSQDTCHISCSHFMNGHSGHGGHETVTRHLSHFINVHMSMCASTCTMHSWIVMWITMHSWIVKWIVLNWNKRTKYWYNTCFHQGNTMVFFRKRRKNRRRNRFTIYSLRDKFIVLWLQEIQSQNKAVTPSALLSKG